GIVDDVRSLWRREAPADRRHHGAGLRGTEEELEIMIAVLAEITDALALLEAVGEKRIGDLVGVAIEFGEARVAALEGKCDRIGARLSEGVDDISERLPVLFFHGEVPEMFGVNGRFWRIETQISPGRHPGT